ncbi:type I restriction modification DNA specificity domain protein [Finegoldia magna ACS-171-V-Col3]|uniref:restriction endonuclease subunit S n=1 Tax=Finegoldia magna TaxID=1260 RepID=UPI0001DE4ABA|nr:restriction endonuclease subunit S [Finegoldia magna]EFK93261.1 type I restriction modification DNA specificity domain protein [Finegoldia magna ACS-171-V-Col3]
MSRLDELIQELCPDGVEYKKIEEVANYEQPSKYIVKSTKYDDSYVTPVLTAGQTFILGYTNETDGIFQASKDNPVIIFDDFTGAFKWVDFPFKIKSSAMKIITIKENNMPLRYLFHIMGNLGFKSDEHKRLWISIYSQLKIPVPPLEVQREIVRILDSFTLLTAELTAELTARKKQYEYYEHNLLFDDKYKRMKLSDLCTVNQGLQIPISKRLKEPRENCYRYITVQFLKNNEDEQYYIENPDKNVICKEDDILVTRTGSTGVIVYGVEGCFHNNFFKVTPNELIHKKYMYFLLRSKYMYNKMLTAASGGTVPDLPHKKFYALEVPVPTIDEQKHIVEMLEKFNELSKDVSIGLPAEIEARQKQYEYYRDKLLTFKQL